MKETMQLHAAEINKKKKAENAISRFDEENRVRRDDWQCRQLF